MSDGKEPFRVVCPQCGEHVPVAPDEKGVSVSCPGCGAHVALTPPPVNPQSATDPLVGCVLGGCKLLERVGRGGMGSVYRAEQVKLNRTVAVKVLSPNLVSDDERYITRFMREARIAAQFNHPNVVQIHDVGTDKGYYYFIMEFVYGESIKQLIKRKGKLVPAEALEIVLQAARGLDASHQAGMVHRDVKPANILIDKQGVVKVSDFGLARTVSGISQLTQTGAVLGTPHYMSPEQCSGEKADIRSDIYSLGVTLFEMLTGQRPFEGESPLPVMMKHLNAPLPATLQESPAIHDSIAALAHKMLAKNPADRFQTPAELVQAVEQATQALRERPAERLEGEVKAPVPPAAPEPTEPPRPGEGKRRITAMVGVVAIVVIGLCAGLYLVLRSPAGETTVAGKAPISGDESALIGAVDALIADSSHRAPIELGEAPAKGVVECALVSEVYGAARPDLADLRVISPGGEEVGYVLRVAKGKSQALPMQVRLYNRTYTPRRQSSVTVDFGRKTQKNRIQIVTAGMDFRRRVLVEGSDDGQSWRTVREGALLFRFAGEADRGYDRDVIAIPENDLRYLRVAVFNGPDDPERVQVEAVKAWRLVREPPETVAVPIKGTEVVTKERATDIVLDLGYPNQPLHELRLRFADANFFRRVHVSGRNRKERVIATPVEDAVPREMTVEEPWSYATSTATYRYSGGETAEESLAINLQRARYRYLQVRIHNGDDPPLHFEGADLTRLVHYIAFQPKESGTYMLYFGNEAAVRPDYDIVRYIQRLRGDGVLSVHLGLAAVNPAAGRPAPKVRWSERHKGILWLALLAVMAVLGFLIFRQSKSIKGAPPLETS